MQLLTESLKREIADAIKPMEGWCSEAKAFAMAELILETKPTLCVEIGVFGGRSIIPQAIALRANGQGLVIAIDPWKKSAALEGENGPENDRWWANLDYHTIHASFVNHIWKNGLDNQVIIVRNTGEQCLTFTDAYGIDQIDLVHIDGNHSEFTSCRDVTQWVPRVRSNGYIWFDDTNWQSTQKALELMLHYAIPVKDVGDDKEGWCRLFQKK